MATSGGIGPHLMADEKILWEGRPPKYLFIRRSDWPLVFFSALFLFVPLSIIADLIFGVRQADRPEPPLVVALFPTIFILFAILIGVVPLVRAARARRATSYALTNKRALIYSERYRSLRTYLLAASAEISTYERRDGSGSIAFGSQPQRLPFMWATFATETAFEFERIAKVRDVMETIQRIQAGRA